MTFYFAWVDPGTAFNAGTHSVEDEEIFSFEIVHSEGDFAQLQIDIRNPRANLLDPSRKLWAWLSQDGTALFFGRLVASPEDIQNEIVRLTFLARPATYEADKEALAESLRTLPYFDPIWLDENRLADPDVVLEARSELWHIDRTTHVLTTSNITVGEDGTVVLNAGDHFYDDLRFTYGAPPLRRVSVKATVNWDQVAVGTLDMTKELLAAFQTAGSPPGVVSSYTGQGLEADWPKANSNLRGGWTIGPDISLRRADGSGRPSRSKIVKVRNITGGATVEAGDLAQQVLEVPGKAKFFIWEFYPTFPVDYDVKRKRVEVVTFTLEADVQALVVDPGEDEEFLITLQTKSVGEPDLTDEYSEPAIGDVRRNSYMKTPRGHQSFQYLMLLARAKLLARARAVEIEIGCPFATGVNLSCRKNVQVFDPRLPNGSAIGKIIEYRLTATGDGEQRCKIVIGCTIGEGNTLIINPGTGTYCDASYCGNDYQQFTGAQIGVANDEMAYDSYDDVPIPDDGINFLNLKAQDVITSFQVFNGESAQQSVLNTTFQDIPAAVEALNAAFTEAELVLRPLTGGPFQTNFDVTVSDLKIPKTIEL
jgi:hypothetical protein